jgi:hypothetical protein
MFTLGGFIKTLSWSCLSPEIKAFIESGQFTDCGPPRSVSMGEVWTMEKRFGPTVTANMITQLCCSGSRTISTSFVSRNITKVNKTLQFPKQLKSGVAEEYLRSPCMSPNEPPIEMMNPITHVDSFLSKDLAEDVATPLKTCMCSSFQIHVLYFIFYTCIFYIFNIYPLLGIYIYII